MSTIFKDSSTRQQHAELVRLVEEDRAECWPTIAERQGTGQGALSHAVLNLTAPAEGGR